MSHPDPDVFWGQFVNPQLNEEDITTQIECDVDESNFYVCSNISCQRVITQLHKWILMVSKFPYLENKIKEYCHLHPENINKFTSNCGFDDDPPYTPLMLSIEHSDKPYMSNIIKILLEAGADPNIEFVDSYSGGNYTALSLLASQQKLANPIIYKLLLDYKANAAYKVNNTSILQIFEKYNKHPNEQTDEIINMLVKYGATLPNIDDTDNVILAYHRNILKKENELLKEHIKYSYGGELFEQLIDSFNGKAKHYDNTY